MVAKFNFKRLRSILIVLFLAIFLHAWAVSLLPQDFDEPVYLQNGFDYAAALRDGGWQAVIDYPGTMEHPALVKLLYGGVVLALGRSATWTNAFYAARAVSAFFGVLAVALLTLAVDPLSGGLLAVHTLAVKYTSQVYLEALPHALTIAAVLAFLRVESGRQNRWFWLSALALGIAAAGKYSYLPVIVIVLAYLAIFEKKTPFGWLVLYGLLAVLTFFLFDVHLWRDPFQRLIESLTYHVQYSQGAHVEEVGYPWYQPFIWIFTASPASWHPEVFFYFGFDGFFSILAFAGVRREWKQRRWLVVWLVAGVLFLLLWPTKWPQYTLSITPAICIMAAGTLARLYHWLREQESYWDYLSNLLPPPSKWFGWSVAAFVVFLAAIYLSAAVKQAVGRIGWSNMSKENSFLPGNTVSGLLPLEDGRMLIATDQGAAIWEAPRSSDEPAHWTVYNQAGSGLVNSHVLALAADASGRYWFGTNAGLSSFDGTTWNSYLGSDLGLPDSTILSLATGTGGQVYAGTLSGASVYDGASWTPLPVFTDQTIFSLAVSSGADGDLLWAGSSAGVTRLEVRSGTTTQFPTRSAVKYILLDSSGTLWAATSGSGLARWQGEDWHYFTTSDSGLPLNTVNWVAEVEPGIFWVATAPSYQAGGTVARFDGQVWHSFQKDNSGTSGGEPMTITLAPDGVIWIGTRNHGIDTYKLGR
jgi:sugar lactone lactonase YvrE